jgi:hypothetical protein
MIMDKDRFDHQDTKRRSRGTKVLRIFGMTLFGIAMAVLFAFVFGLFVKWLWNWLMPAIFGLGVITFWQAFGIVLLAKLLFGGFGHHHDKHSHDHPMPSKIAKFVHGDKHQPKFNHGNGKNWKHFRQYWEDEGRSSFEDYVSRKENSEDKAGNRDNE